MICSWNCRGMGSTQAVRSLKDLIRQQDPDVLFLSETKARKERMEIVKKKIKFKGSHFVEPVGRSGGLALLWKEGIEVDILASSSHQITGSQGKLVELQFAEIAMEQSLELHTESSMPIQQKKPNLKLLKLQFC